MTNSAIGGAGSRLPPSYSTAQAVATLIPAVGGKAQELPLHRVDPGDIGRDEVIAAALAGHHVKTTAHEGLGGTCAAEMNECGEILFLLRACRHIARAGENAATLRSRYTAASSIAWLGIARIYRLVNPQLASTTAFLRIQDRAASA